MYIILKYKILIFIMKLIFTVKFILNFVLLIQLLNPILNQYPFFNNYSYNENTNINRINFINSNLLPVLIIPGILGTSLKVELKCKNYIKSLENTEDLNIFTKYCINNGICSNKNKEEIETYK